MSRFHVSILICLLWPCLTLCNIAQPGMWQAGGMGNYALHFSEDSIAYQKIQMEKERVSILLYPGFAVVKGEYWMKNTSSDTFTISTGYPIRSLFESQKSMDLMQLEFDSLYGLRVLIDDQEAVLREEPWEHPASIDFGAENWYVWDNTFPGSTTTKVTVYFLMNTNDAEILKGYDKDHHNGFIYLLETGAIWKQPIVEGEIRLKLQPPLSLEDIHGQHPKDAFLVDQQTGILQSIFSNLTPDYNNNIVINYGEEMENFDFEAKVSAKEQWFEVVDAFSTQDLSILALAPYEFGDPFEVTNIEKAFDFFWGAGLGGLIGFILAFLYRKRFRKKE